MSQRFQYQNYLLRFLFSWDLKSNSRVRCSNIFSPCRCLLNVAVTKLREHWDETNSKVMQRKTQLDMMLGDSQRYEAKRNEVEVWLARMETRLERMRAVGHTADVLEAQLREQKVHRTLFPSFCNRVSSSSRWVFSAAREKCL